MLSIRRLVMLSVVPAGLLLGAPKSGKTDKVEYTSGTVKAVPQNAQGSLDLDDSTELRFHYKNSVYAVPYDRITSSEKGQKTSVAGKLRVVPGLFSRNKSEHLTVWFKDDQGKDQRMTFALSKERLETTLPALQAKTTKPAESASRQQPTWWGDKYWRTNRNAHLWPNAEEPAPQTAPHK